jgi:cell division initiation protein
MITPLDIQNKQFAKGVRGYKEDEVDSFLDLLTLDFEKAVKENYLLKEQIRTMNHELERFRNSEVSVYDTLEVAKSLMNDISLSAEKRASMVMKNAELDAQLILREAKESVERLNEEYISVKNRLHIFKTRYKTLLEAELEKFDTLSSEIFSDKDLDDLRSLTDQDHTAARKPEMSYTIDRTTKVMDSIRAVKEIKG